MTDVLDDLGIPPDPNGTRDLPDGPVTLRKRHAATVTAIRVQEPGVCHTERGPMSYDVGDWILTNDSDGQQWPVSDEYLRANYEVA